MSASNPIVTPSGAAPSAPSRATFVPSSNVAQLRESATIAVSQRAKELRAAGRTILDLGAGEPDGETPAFIRRAARAALEVSAATRYTAVEGMLSLREAIAALAAGDLAPARAVSPSDVVVTAGTKQALFNACFALFGAGDEVLVPAPAWTSYSEMVALARAAAVPVPGDPARDLKVDAAALQRWATPRTRGVVLNSPCNPTGAVYTRAELAELCAVAERHGWWVISDEIYRRIAYEAPAASALDVAAGYERLVVVDGVAKAYAMTGWRIGWAIAPRPVARAMTALQSHTTSNATTLAQYAALAALTERGAADAAVDRMVAELRHRRDRALAIVDAAGAPRCVRPAGAFYLFFDVGAAGAADEPGGTRVARRLLDAHGVAVVPGAAFHAPDWIRLSYAAPEADVVAGVERLVECYAELTARVAPGGGPGA